MSKLIKIDVEYKDWITQIAERFRRSQIKAALKANSEMLKFYWFLGKDIVAISEKNRYGSGFYNTLSEDLTSIFPDVHSFSPTNLKYMRYFYELYSDAVNRPQLEDDLAQGKNHPQLGDDFVELPVFYIPWGHNKTIIDKCKDDSDKALFYVKKTLENNWSRAVLVNFLDTDLYERQGKAITNFSLTLPEDQSDLAQQMTKDPYCFDFLTLQQRYNEKELKDALMNKAEKFLMELGTGFALMGREVRLEVGDTEKYLDMLFYNTKRHCYVVVEVKAVDFDSSFAGQLGTYVVAVNHQIKTELDNPTVGLLICKGMDKVEAQYALESTSQPLGISSYQLSKLIPEDFKGSMPTIEEIEAELSDATVDSEGKGGQEE
jgi:predicted nuclease of restriction endonuclease-like (RecB) superfamily